ncbi:unnamed protein product [Bursaphelenchus xylophilus]|uniref:tRNA pseudouridine synthase n=1 Tax=Bursaphelenchus xylophilus TaxID=6326 RepID=A0A1I7S3B0_BURXY|nr:unnamed protein product [Bursaphelenchus xylophilus]CAG9116182.1 unnamed protein product [Bursaphelenchus xylophilus]
MHNRYLLWLRFDGSHFNGFAKAGGKGYGVIDFLYPALSRVLAHKNVDRFNVFPCSRTDTDVHVLRAPVVLNVPKDVVRLDIDRESLLQEINTTFQTFYPNSVEALDFHWVSPGFCARKHAIYRRYIYRFRVARTMEWYTQFEKTPSLACFSERFYALTVPSGFDIAKSNKACEMLMGTHNVASFLKHPLRVRGTEWQGVMRNIDLIRIVSGEPITGIEDPHFEYFNFEVISKSFVREQIRRMVRIIVKCGYEDRYIDHLRIMLRCPDPATFIQLGHRASNGKGLYLVDVVYDKDHFENPVPFYKHPIDRIDESSLL